MRALTKLTPLVIIAAIVVVLVGAFAFGAPSVVTKAAVPSCVKPSSNPTHQQMVNYQACLQSRTEAMLTNAQAPAATVTSTVTTTATETATATATVTVTQTVTASPSPSSTPTPTPTSMPTSTPTAQPSGDWPGPSNTGVPAGTDVQPWEGTSCTITADTTITARHLYCPDGLLIRAQVTISKSYVQGRIVVDTDINRSWSLRLVDSEVDAGDGNLPAIFNGNVDILRANIHGGHNGLECQEHSTYCKMKDSWVHDQWVATGEEHLGGFLGLGTVMDCTGSDANGVPACVELIHNKITCDAPVSAVGGGCTGDINLINHFGPLHGALIVGNLLGANPGAAFCTYGSAGFEHPADHIVYRDNVFQRGPNSKCASYGPVTNFDVGAVGNEWTNNRWDDGRPVPPQL